MELRSSLEVMLAKLKACGEALVRARKSADPEERKTALLEASNFFRADSALRGELRAKAFGEPTLADYFPESLPPEPPGKGPRYWMERARNIRKGGGNAR